MPALDRFLAALETAAEKLAGLAARRVLLLHHNDCDGLTSAAIMLKTLEQTNIRVSSYALEKPYPKVLKILFAADPGEFDAIIFLDFGSGMLALIDSLNVRNIPLFVLDHHAPQTESSVRIILVNPHLYGLSGPLSTSSSVITYLFACSINEYAAPLSGLALLGALGDGILSSAQDLAGPNLKIFQAAEAAGAAGFDGDYWISSAGRKTAGDLVRYVDALGSFAYFDSGPDIAIKGLTEGFSEPFVLTAQRYVDDFESKYREFKQSLQLQVSAHLAWFDLGTRFAGYGVKTVGLICSRLIQDDAVPADRYLAGFQMIPDQIPGLGAVSLNEYKVSLRVPPGLLKEIASGRRPGVAQILPAATLTVSGFSDACHAHAGASTLDPQRKDDLLRELERQVALIISHTCQD